MATGEKDVLKEEYDFLNNVIDLDFQSLALKHNEVLNEAVHTEFASDEELLRRMGYADVIKAVMKFRFPEGHDIWFNE